jgi:hypothetical protein
VLFLALRIAGAAFGHALLRLVTYSRRSLTAVASRHSPLIGRNTDILPPFWAPLRDAKFQMELAIALTNLILGSSVRPKRIFQAYFKMSYAYKNHWKQDVRMICTCIVLAMWHIQRNFWDKPFEFSYQEINEEVVCSRAAATSVGERHRAGRWGRSVAQISRAEDGGEKVRDARPRRP